MDTVLRALMVSDYAPPMKSALLTKVLQAPVIPDAAMARKLMALAQEWCLACSDSASLEATGAEMLLQHCQQQHPVAFLEQFPTSTIEALPQKPPTLGGLLLLRLVMSRKTQIADLHTSERDCERVSKIVGEVFMSDARQQSALTLQLVLLLTEIPACCPRQIEMWRFGVVFLGEVQSDAPQLAEALINLIKASWMDPSLISQSLSVIFEVLASSEVAGNCWGLSGLLQCISTDYVQLVTPYLLGLQSRPDSRQVETVLARLLDWPAKGNTPLWVCAVMRGLAAAGKGSTVASVFQQSLTSLFNQMYSVERREGAFMILECLLLGHQSTNAFFHKIAPEIPRLMYHAWVREAKLAPPPPMDLAKTLSKNAGAQPQAPPQETTTTTAANSVVSSVNDKEKDSVTPMEGVVTTLAGAAAPPSPPPFVLKFGRLCLTLMYHFSGYPELYLPLLQWFQFCPIPSEDEVRATLRTNAWTVAPGVRADDEGDSAPQQQAAGRAGLVNLGNTCYMNSFLQALFTTFDFRKLIHTSKPVGAARPAMVAVELQRVFAFLQLTQRPAIAPSGLHRVVPAQYRDGSQQDASEFGRYLLDDIESAFKNTSAKEEFQQIFGGNLLQTIRCSTCGSKSETTEPFFDLSLSFQEGDQGRFARPLADLVSSFLAPETMEGDNRYHCSTCGDLQVASRQVSLPSAPKHLVLSLKRFSYDYATQRRSKVMTPVTCPIALDMPCTPADGPAFDASYVLYAVLVHSGASTSAGHYYVYARDSSAAMLDQESAWLLFNDGNVSNANFDSISRVTSHFQYDLPYMLFYRRRDPPSPPSINQLNAVPGGNPFDTSSMVSAVLAQAVQADNARIAKERSRPRQVAEYFKPYRGPGPGRGGPGAEPHQSYGFGGGGDLGGRAVF